jgi:hypothetical protein
MPFSFRFFLVFCGVFFGILFFGQNVQAFSVSPLRHTMVVDPGKTAVAEVEVFNIEDTAIKLVPEIDAFRIHPDTGHAQFGEIDDAKGWIVVNTNEFTLGPKEKKIVRFTVNVPPGTVPRSHYLGLFLKEKSFNSQIAIGKRIGTLLFLHVGGDVQEKMELQNFSILKTKTKKLVSIQTINTGSIHLIPAGTIEFFNIFGKKVAEKQVNFEGRKVLPGGVWRNSLSLNDLKYGILYVHLNLNYGLTEQKITEKITFWNFSKIFMGSLIVLSLIVVFSLLVRKYEKYEA